MGSQFTSLLFTSIQTTSLCCKWSESIEDVAWTYLPGGARSLLRPWPSTVEYQVFLTSTVLISDLYRLNAFPVSGTPRKVVQYASFCATLIEPCHASAPPWQPNFLCYRNSHFLNSRLKQQHLQTPTLSFGIRRERGIQVTHTHTISLLLCNSQSPSAWDARLQVQRATRKKPCMLSAPGRPDAAVPNRRSHAITESQPP